MNTPLSPAIQFGARVLHVVYLDPDIKYIPLSALQTTLGTLQRTIAITMAASFNRDIETARHINQGLAIVRGGAPGGRGGMDSLVRAADPILQHERQHDPYHQLTIHRYHPRDLLGGAADLLNFRRDNLETLIQRGYADATTHDCADAGCVLPVGAASRERGVEP
jgi:hypothetical protein